MKKKINLVILLITFLMIGFSGLYSNTPDSLMREDDPEYRREREEWIELMHMAEPGVDWRIIEQETRMSKFQIKNEMRRDLLRQGKLERDRILSETVAGGRIKGAWIERGSDNLAGRMITVDIDFDRGLIYGISAGGNVWRGTLNGRNWTSLNDYHKFSGSLIKVIRHGDANRILVVSNNNVYFTDNEGLTWESAEGLEDIQFWGSIRRGAVQNNDEKTIYIAANEWDKEAWTSVRALYKSNDHGETFEKLYRTPVNGNLIDIWAPQYHGSVVYIMERDTIRQIDESGDMINTEIFSGELPVPSFDQLSGVMLKGCVDAQNNITLAAVLRMNQDPRSNFYVSDDLGDNWEKKGSLDINPFMINSFAVSNLTPNAIFYGGVELFRSMDRGETWEKVNNWGEYYGDIVNKLHADIPGVNLFIDPEDPQNELMFISTDGGLYISDQYTFSVENISLKDLNISQYYSVYTHGIDNNYIYLGSQDQGFQRCDTDSGAVLSFEQTISGDYGHLTSSDKGETLWCVYPGFVMNYTNTRGKLKTLFWNFRNNSNRLWMPKIVADPENPDQAFVAAGGDTNGASLWRVKLDSGAIKAYELPYDFAAEESSMRISTFEISEINSNYFYLMNTAGHFYISPDRGNTWKLQSEGEFSGHYFYGAKVLPSERNMGELYIGGSGYSNPGFFYSNDHGQTFVPADSGLPNTLIYDMTFGGNEKYIYAATQAGPYVYIAEEGRWFDLAGIDTPDQTYWEVEYVPSLNTVRFVTYGRGVWDFRIEEFVSVETDDQTASAAAISVQAYPNPFSSASEISIMLDKAARASVKIIDINGRPVKNLYHGLLDEGISAVKWDGTSDAGNALPHGMYLCIVSAGGNTAYTKILLER